LRRSGFVCFIFMLNWTEKFGALDAIESLLGTVSFVLFIIMLCFPSWVVYYDLQNSFYSVGLWATCKDGLCVSAWNRQNFWNKELFTDSQWSTFFYYNATPPIIIASQAFAVAAILCQFFLVFLRKLNTGFKALLKCIPALFYTVSFCCAVVFFSLALRQAPSGIIGGTWGYAASCGLVGLILYWVSIICLIIQYCLERIDEKERDKRRCCFVFQPARCCY
jgi:multidrug transporter EmrE-like cation transporter